MPKSLVEKADSLYADPEKWQRVYLPALSRVGYPWDPDAFVGVQWPHVKLYPKQRETFHSVRDNRITIVHAAHETGKDFVAALIVLWFFCSREPAFIVTTSSQAEQLNDALWGELRKQIEDAQHPELFGPFGSQGLAYNHMMIRRFKPDGGLYPQSKITGKVVQRGESFQGFHLPEDVPRTLCLFDEASSMQDEHYTSAKSWAHRILVFGNPLPTTNFFYHDSKAGDQADVAISGVA